MSLIAAFYGISEQLLSLVATRLTALTLTAIRHHHYAERVAFDNQALYMLYGQPRMAKGTDLAQGKLPPLLPPKSVISHAPLDLLKPVFGIRPPSLHVFPVALPLGFAQECFARYNFTGTGHNSLPDPSAP
ncbi:MAG TPA: hypothetical protein VGR81_00965 [Candidatus Acidoferrales bacterium]|nr:hypothetical protein [Candidatus Acidoferrales bacterium]